MVNKSIGSDLSGKRVLVTGGTRGIGAAIVRQLLDAGAKVVGSARTPVNDFAQDATFIQGDVGTLAGARELAARATELLGGVDILVNNAGAARAWPKGTLAIEDEEWVDALNANYLSAVRLSAALLPTMIARKSGVIVNISTVAALIPPPALAHYGAAKAALNAYSKSLAAEVAPHGIRVNVVVPGNVTTPGADKIRVDLATAVGVEASALTANIPLGRVGAPTDIASMVSFLVSDRAAWITGASFVVDGGETPFVQ
ncbi:MAG: short chain dehydrogenase [Labilithrix sp.]|nr:short chain dehydrogenase [Labilithrix sp.]